MSSLNEPVAKRIAKLFRLLASDFDGEVLAARRLKQQLTTEGLSFDDITTAIENVDGKIEEKKYSDADADAEIIFNRGIKKGHAEEARKHEAPPDFYDTDGYPRWNEIALFCQRNSSRLRDEYQRTFINDMADARTSQLEHLEVRDLHDDGAAPRLMMPSSQKGKRRRVDRKPVPIPVSLAKSLRQAAADRARREPLLQSPGGETLRRRWLKRAVAAAGLALGTTLYALRHSSIVRTLLAGTPSSPRHQRADDREELFPAHGDHADTVVRRALLDIAAPAGANIVPLVRS